MFLSGFTFVFLVLSEQMRQIENEKRKENSLSGL